MVCGCAVLIALRIEGNHRVFRHTKSHFPKFLLWVSWYLLDFSYYITLGSSDKATGLSHVIGRCVLGSKNRDFS